MKRFLSHLLFYPTVGWNLIQGKLDRNRHWWDEVDEQLILGALPLKRFHPQLRQLGVTAVLNMCAEWEDPLEELAADGIVYHRVPTVDFFPPEYEQILEGVQFVSEQTEAGGRVYVHCKAGRGRSAMVVMCWLMHNKQMAPEEVYEYLLTKRPQVIHHLDKAEPVQIYQKQMKSTQ